MYLNCSEQWIRPYSVECTRSRSISEVKQLQAGLVLGWVTAWEYPVPYPFHFLTFGDPFPGIVSQRRLLGAFGRKFRPTFAKFA